MSLSCCSSSSSSCVLAAECGLVGGAFELSPDLESAGAPGDAGSAVVVHVAQASVVAHLLQHHVSSFVYFVFGCSPYHHGARWVCDLPHGRITKRIRIAIPNASRAAVRVELRVVPLLERESAHMKQQRASGKRPSQLGFQPVLEHAAAAVASASSGKREPPSSWSAIIEPSAFAQVDLVPLYQSSTSFLIQALVDDCLCYEWSAVVLHQNNNQQKHLRPDYRVPTVCRIGPGPSLLPSPADAMSLSPVAVSPAPAPAPQPLSPSSYEELSEPLGADLLAACDELFSGLVGRKRPRSLDDDGSSSSSSSSSSAADHQHRGHHLFAAGAGSPASSWPSSLASSLSSLSPMVLQQYAAFASELESPSPKRQALSPSALSDQDLQSLLSSSSDSDEILHELADMIPFAWDSSASSSPPLASCDQLL